MPRAVDSITQEAAPRSLYSSRLNTSATLPGKEALLGPRGAENQIHRDKDDGLAAILAAKIRTKAELKQVRRVASITAAVIGGARCSLASPSLLTTFTFFFKVGTGHFVTRAPFFPPQDASPMQKGNQTESIRM